MYEYDSIIASHKHRKQSSAVVKVPYSLASDPGSIPGQVSDFL